MVHKLQKTEERLWVCGIHLTSFMLDVLVGGDGGTAGDEEKGDGGSGRPISCAQSGSANFLLSAFIIYHTTMFQVLLQLPPWRSRNLICTYK